MPIPSLAEAHIQNDSTQKTYGISVAAIPGSRCRWFPYLSRANRPQTTPNEEASSGRFLLNILRNRMRGICI
jgi:hypothetical protein